MDKKIALIPSYEPDDKLKYLVEELHNNNFEIIVVNDGSNKKYNEIFNSLTPYAKVLSYDENQGKGYALKYGLKYIKNNYSNNYIVVTMDSDGQHTVKDALKLIEYTSNHPNELVLGKRIRSKKTPLRSRIGNSITRFIYHITTGVNIYDTQTGLRCFTNKLIDFLLNVDGNRYEYEMNVLLASPREKIKLTEIEIETIYIDNNSGSHFNALTDSFKIYKEILKFALSSIIGFIVDYISYIILFLISNNLILSNIIARIISATTNYNINRNIVFNSNKKVSTSLFEYFILATFILILNTLLLKLLVSIKINAFIAKIIVELALFILSWSIQKKIIFKKEGDYYQKV